MKAFVETTVIVDVLLKPAGSGLKAQAALRRFTDTMVPVYAIKEFKAGPLKNFVWFHNKLVQCKTFAEALGALHAMSRTPRRYTTSTAIEALKSGAEALQKKTLKEWVDRYGADAKPDSIIRDHYQVALKTAILKAWKRRRSVTSAVVDPLACYEEVAPTLENGLIELGNLKCVPTGACCLSPRLKAAPQDLEKLRDAVKAENAKHPKVEHQRRYQVLRELVRKPKSPLDEADCCRLGDAVFAFFCPADATILTTNSSDLEPLAAALGKRVERP